MRLAIVAASSYEENGQVSPIPNAEVDVELFGRRLAEPDAGFTVHAFDAERGLAEGIEDLTRSLGGRARSLVFYFWGYALLSEERGPTLLLDGPKLSTFTLARLRRLLAEVTDEALVVVDATLAEGSAGAPLDVVRAMGSALSGRESRVSSLISVRPAQRRVQVGPPPFTGLVQLILDTQTGSAQALTPETLFRAMQAEEVMFADIPAAGCFLAQNDFVVVPGAAPSGPPPAQRAFRDAEEITSQRAIARPAPPPPPPPPLPLPPPPSAVPPSTPDSAVVRRSELPPEPVTLPRAAPPPPAPRPSGKFAPEDPEGYRFLLRHFERKGEADGVYRAALCLDALGEADINESMLVTAHRPDGLQPVRTTLSYADYHERLCVGLAQPATLALLRAVAPALARIGFQHVRRQKRDVTLPEEALQEVEKSTTTLAKTLHWVSRLLCVPVSELYVLPELSGTLGLLPGPDSPRVACARALGSGFSLPELVFLWARELAFARREEAALCYFSEPGELEQLLLGALALGGATSMRAIDGEAKRTASGLKREVRGAELAGLTAAAQSFAASSGVGSAEVARHALAFSRMAELVAARIGLVACGQLDTALALAERFPRARFTSAAERRADLLQFTVSPEHGQIRHALGVAVG